MLCFRDFVPQVVKPAAFLLPEEHEPFAAALAAANAWIADNRPRLVNVETVVLPNIWRRWEEGSQDTSLSDSSGLPSTWHQFIRVWYETDQ